VRGRQADGKPKDVDIGAAVTEEKQDEKNQLGANTSKKLGGWGGTSVEEV